MKWLAVLILAVFQTISYSETCAGKTYSNSNCENTCAQNICQDVSFNLDASKFQCCPGQTTAKVNPWILTSLLLVSVGLFTFLIFFRRKNLKVASSLCIGFLATRIALADGFGSTDYFGIWNTVYRAAAQKSTTDPNVVIVGRTWHQGQYKALISSYLSTSGFVDNLFVGNTTSGVVGKQLYDLSGAGFDNLCSAITYAYDGFIIGCRSMKANGLYDVYLVKLANNGVLDTSFSTSGIKATALGGTTGHAFVRGIVYDSVTGNGGENGTVVLTGAIGTYSGGVFHPYVAAFSQKTGAQYGSTTTLAGIDGTGVAIAIDTANSKYYTASTQTVNNHSFYVHQYNTSLTAAGGNWGAAVDFTKAIGDAAADSVPSSIMMNGSDVVTLGGNRVDTTAAWRCAMVAHKTSDGTLNTTFGKVPAPLAAGVDSSGISLFTLNTSRDCIINSAVTPPSGSNILPVGTIYNGTNYDFLVAKLSSVGALDTSFSTDGILIQSSGPGDDVLNSAIYLDGSNTYVYGAGRSHHSSLYNGGTLAQVATASGAYTNNVVFSLDAAKSSAILGFPGSGCLDTTFRDLSSNQKDGTLTNFSSCGASSGWNGAGTGSSPYRLTFDGSNDNLSIPSTVLGSVSGDFSAVLWIYPTTLSGYVTVFDSSSRQLSLWISSGWYGIGTSSAGLTYSIPFTTNAWQQLAMTRAGSSATVYRNGSSTATATNGSAISAQTWVLAGNPSGGGVNYTGSIATTTLYNREVTTNELKALFNAQADAYRATPVGTVVTNGLVLNYDAANAKVGMSAFANGCAAGDLSWFDLSSSALNGTLTSFASCGTSEGWNGDGTTTVSGAAGPYRLTFDGTADYVSVTNGFTNTVAGDDTHTISMWIYPTSLAGQGAVLLDATSLGGFDYFIEFYNTQGFYWGTGGSYRTYSGMSLSTNNWYNLAVVKTGAGDSGELYLNGKLQSTYSGTLSSMSSSASPWMLGCYRGQTYCHTGSIPSFSIYNRALSAAEVLQNCNALKSRFSGATCG